MGIAFQWLKYNLNYTKARALRVTVLLGYVEITITVYSISQHTGYVNNRTTICGAMFLRYTQYNFYHNN